MTSAQLAHLREHLQEYRSWLAHEFEPFGIAHDDVDECLMSLVVVESLTTADERR